MYFLYFCFFSVFVFVFIHLCYWIWNAIFARRKFLYGSILWITCLWSIYYLRGGGLGCLLSKLKTCMHQNRYEKEICEWVIKLYILFSFGHPQSVFPETDGPEGEVMVSYTEVSGLRFANILVVNLTTGTTYTMYPKDTGVYSSDVSNGWRHELRCVQLLT